MHSVKTETCWLALVDEPLPLEEALSWASSSPSCGAVVSFLGNARNNSAGREDVKSLFYEAYENQVLPRLEALAKQIQKNWPDIERLVLLHRTGSLEIGESAVAVMAAAPHRKEAFKAAEYGIDVLKSTIPIWKKEVWKDGESWGLEAQHIEEINEETN